MRSNEDCVVTNEVCVSMLDLALAGSDRPSLSSLQDVVLVCFLPPSFALSFSPKGRLLDQGAVS